MTASIFIPDEYKFPIKPVLLEDYSKEVLAMRANGHTQGFFGPRYRFMAQLGNNITDLAKISPEMQLSTLVDVAKTITLPTHLVGKSTAEMLPLLIEVAREVGKLHKDVTEVTDDLVLKPSV